MPSEWEIEKIYLSAGSALNLKPIPDSMGTQMSKLPGFKTKPGQNYLLKGQGGAKFPSGCM